jgi:hypothetical protein
VIGDSITATVAVVGVDFVDLHLTEVDGAHLGRITLDVQRRSPIVNGVTGIVIKRLEENRVRLGFEVEDGVSVARLDSTGSG